MRATRARGERESVVGVVGGGSSSSGGGAGVRQGDW
jgi:hypothetical protein